MKAWNKLLPIGQSIGNPVEEGSGVSEVGELRYGQLPGHSFDVTRGLVDLRPYISTHPLETTRSQSFQLPTPHLSRFSLFPLTTPTSTPSALIATWNKSIGSNDLQ